MKRLVVLYRSTLGKKLIVAISGILMLGFLVGHMAGNLKVFLPPVQGQPDIDHYAESLREFGVPYLPHGAALWTARTVLLLALILHVVCVIQLSRQNRSARPVAYENHVYTQATQSAHWMMYTGLFLLVFVVFHILHFTFGVINPSSFEHGAVFNNLQLAFDHFGWVAVYIVSMVILVAHLYHGAWSLFQTLGWDHPDRNRLLRRSALGISIVLFIGFVAVPTALFFPVLRSHRPSEPQVERTGDTHLVNQSTSRKSFED